VTLIYSRGGKNNSHIGNEKLREMARNVTEVYKSASKKEKTKMAWDLIQRVKALKPPGRFLRRIDTGAWEEVDIHSAREKAGQCLRDAVAQEKLDIVAGRDKASSSQMPPLVAASASSLPNRPSTPESMVGKKEPNVVQASPTPVASASRRSSVSFKMDTDDSDAMDTSSPGTAKRQRLGTWNKVVSRRVSDEEVLEIDGTCQEEEVMRQRLGTWDRDANNLPLRHSQVPINTSSDHHVIPMEESVLVDIDGHTGEHTVMIGNDLEEWLQEGLNMSPDHEDQQPMPMRIYREDEDVFYSDFF
jgi:hypothetical protein